MNAYGEPFDVRKPFTFKRGLAEGATRAELEGPAYRRLFFGIYVLAAIEVTPALRAEAALLVAGPGAFASHFTAARVRGVPVPDHADEFVTVASQRRRVKRRGIHCSVRPDARTDVVRGIAVSTREDLFVELAAHLSLVDLVVAGDHLVRRCGLTIRRLKAAVKDLPGAVGRRAHHAAGYVRERVDSPMESRLRMLLVLAGIPEPRVNLTIADVDGFAHRRYDLCWPKVRVVVEYDGRHHIERTEQWEADLARRDGIDDDGWRMIVVVASGIYQNPADTVARVHRVLQQRGLPGLPQVPKEDWRPHFLVWAAAS